MYADFSLLGPLFGGIILIALILSIIGSFIIDSVVLLISMFVLHIENKTTFFWKHIWGIFFLGGIINIIVLIILNFINVSMLGFLSFIPKILLFGGLTFIGYYLIIFRQDDESIRKKMSIVYAIINVLCMIF